MASRSMLYVGVRGYILGIDRSTGQDVWATSLKGAEFVNVMWDGGELYATSKGRVYRLDPTTGSILWENGLTGMGWGLVSMARAGDGNVTEMSEKLRQDEAAAARRRAGVET